MEVMVGIGFGAWTLTGLVVLAKQLVVFRAERRRQRLMLKCDYWECYGPAHEVLVMEDTVRGFCERHLEQELRQEQGNDGDGYDDSFGDDPEGEDAR